MKLKLTSMTILILVPSFVTAMSNLTDPAPKRRIQIGILFSPDYSYRSLHTTGTSDDTYKNYKALRDQMEIYKFGYSTGLQLKHDINHHFEIETGMHLSNKGFQSEKTPMRPLVPEPSIPDYYTNIYKYYYLEMPLKLNFKMKIKKASVFAGLGLVTHRFLYLEQKTVSYFSNHKEVAKSKQNSSYSNFYFSSMFSFGIDFPMKKSLTFRIEPQIKYGLNPIYKSDMIKEKLYNFGLNLVLYKNI